MHDVFSARVVSERRVYECRFGAQQTFTLTKWAGASMWHSRGTALAASTLALLVIGSVFAPAEGAMLTTWSTVSLTCSVDSRAMTFRANDRWQEVAVNATDQDFTGQCVVEVNFTSSSSASLATFVGGQPAVLVKVYKLQILPVGSPCSFGYMNLDIQPIAKPVSGNRICTEYADDALYIWVSEPIQLYLFVWPNAYTRTSFSAAFGVVRSVNICLPSSDNSELLIAEVDVYTFAPDTKFSELLPLSTTCRSRRQLLVTPANSLSSLTMIVLAAPTNPSCWSLLLNDVHVGDTRTQSFATGANVSLLYRRSSVCFTSDRQRGFTIKWSAAPSMTVASTLTTTAPAIYVNQSAGTHLVGDSSASIATVPAVSASLPGVTDLQDTSVVSVAVGSSVAALVVMATMLVVALLVIRRRRIMRHRNSLYDSMHPPMTSVLSLADTDVAWSVNNDHPEHPYLTPSQHPQSPPSANFSISSPVAQNTSVGYLDVVMTDNDLYSTNFSS